MTCQALSTYITNKLSFTFVCFIFIVAHTVIVFVFASYTVFFLNVIIFVIAIPVATDIIIAIDSAHDTASKIIISIVIIVSIVILVVSIIAVTTATMMTAVVVTIIAITIVSDVLVIEIKVIIVVFIIVAICNGIYIGCNHVVEIVSFITKMCIIIIIGIQIIIAIGIGIAVARAVAFTIKDMFTVTKRLKIIVTDTVTMIK